MKTKEKKKIFLTLPQLETGTVLQSEGSMKLTRKQMKAINKLDRLSAIYIDTESKAILFLSAGEQLVINE